jgi:hypothetical protein
MHGLGWNGPALFLVPSHLGFRETDRRRGAGVRHVPTRTPKASLSVLHLLRDPDSETVRNGKLAREEKLQIHGYSRNVPYGRLYPFNYAVCVRNVISRQISGSVSRSETRPDRGRLLCMAVGPLSRSATIKGEASRGTGINVRRAHNAPTNPNT